MNTLKVEKFIYSASTVAETNENGGCKCFDISKRNPATLKPRRDTSMYTSRGIKKATEDDPIRTIEHINAAKEYYLNNGKTEFLKYRNHMIFVLGITTGLRGGDLLNLHVEDVLNADGTIRKYIRTIESKTQKTNTPMINDVAADAIYMYLSNLPYINSKEYLIRSERSGGSGKLDHSQLYRILHKLNTDLGFEEHIGAHSMRKTFAYWNLKMHPDDSNALATIQYMMNHESSQTTLRYCGISREDKDKYYTSIADIFKQ